MTEPRYQVGQKVTHPPSLYDETEGEIIGVERVFAEVEDDGTTFKEDGLWTAEGTLSCLNCPYKLEGDTLIIESRAGTRTSKFMTWSYSVSTEKMCMAVLEKSITLRT